MIQLYGRRNSINVQKVSWALCELNIEFKWHDEHGKFGTVNVENYEKLNPQMIVPTLDHNGTIINQSNSIVRYLYRKYTDVYEISKAEDIAIAEQWMEFQATDLQLNMTPIFWGLVRNPPEDRDQDLIDKNIILYIDDCIEAILRFMRQDTFKGPINIGSEEKVTINELAKLALKAADKDKRSYINNIKGQEFIDKYGFKCPVGVRGRNSDNKLYKEKMGWAPGLSLLYGMKETFKWINKQVNG